MKIWKKPEARMEAFEANDVIAACYFVQCLYAGENGGHDIMKPDSNNVLHRYGAGNCGEANGSEVFTDKDGNIEHMVHYKKGNFVRPCTVYEDAGYSTLKTTVTDGELIYFTTSDGKNTWYHRGNTVQNGNHS